MKKVVVLICCSLTISSCQTHLEGIRLDPNGRVVAPQPNEKTRISQIDGLPAQLLKPQFKLSATKTDDVLNYSLVAEAVPDPDHRYTINLDPATFSDSTLQITFGPQGNITTLNPTTTTQIPGLITSLGNFTVNALKAFSPFTLDESDDDFGTLPISLLVIEIQNDISTKSPAVKAEWNSRIKKRIQAYDDNLDKFHAKYHDATEIERELLISVRDAAEISRSASTEFTAYTAKLKVFDGEIKTLETNSEEEVVANTKSILVKQLDAAREYKRQIAKYVNTAHIKSLLSLRTNYFRLVAGDPNETITGLGDLLEAAVDLLQTKPAKLFGVVQPILNLPSANWSWRHVQYLEQLIDETTKQIVSKSSSLDGQDNDSALSALYKRNEELNQRRVETITNKSTFDQWILFREKLNSLPTKTVTTDDGNTLTTNTDFEGYDKLRDNFAEVETSIDSARTKLKSKAEDNPELAFVLDKGTSNSAITPPSVGIAAPADQIVRHFYLKSTGPLTNENIKKQITAKLANLGLSSNKPDYILVLEREYTSMLEPYPHAGTGVDIDIGTDTDIDIGTDTDTENPLPIDADEVEMR